MIGLAPAELPPQAVAPARSRGQDVTHTRGFSKSSSALEERLKGLHRSSPSATSTRAAPKSVEEQLFDSLASFKLQTAAVASRVSTGLRLQRAIL
jgi:hypothetical protein